MKASARSLAVAVGCLRTKTPNQNPTRLYYFFLVARRVDERDQTGRGKKKEGFIRVRRADLFSSRRDGEHLAARFGRPREFPRSEPSK
jgi:hypothetical protein